MTFDEAKAEAAKKSAQNNGAPVYVNAFVSLDKAGKPYIKSFYHTSWFSYGQSILRVENCVSTEV